MELSEKNIQILENEGFETVYEWFDKPGARYPAHIHEHATTMIVSEGMMDVNVDGETKILNAGERIDIKANVGHSVIVGSDGCKYVVGEK